MLAENHKCSFFMLLFIDNIGLSQNCIASYT